MYQRKKINNLEVKISLKETENKSLRRVLYENDLIPEEYVKWYKIIKIYYMQYSIVIVMKEK